MARRSLFTLQSFIVYPLCIPVPYTYHHRSLDLAIVTMDLLYADMTYCSLCDRYFPGDEARAQHVQLSTNHPKCERCNRRFANRNSLRNHLVYSPRHNYCAVCEREFRTAAGLRVHVEYAAVHRDDSDDDDADSDIDDAASGWEDELGRREFPEENEHAEADIRAGRDPYTPADEYWDEDDETDFEEEEEAYYGFASVPSSAQSQISRTIDSVRIMSLNDIGLSPASSTPSSPRVDTPEVVEAPQPHIARSPAGQQDMAAPSEANAVNTAEGVISPIVAPKPQIANRPQLINAPAATKPAFTCPLCLESPSSFTATRCGHVFCTPCITHVMTTTVMCPVCRRPNGSRQLRTIYLPPLT